MDAPKKTPSSSFPRQARSGVLRAGKTTRVLVAEDDYLVARDIARCLEEIGCTVVGKTSDGLEAVKEVRRLCPDVVLMDIQMPKLDGLAATRRIQETCPTPVVIMTAYESADLVTRASEAGAGAYLTKPPVVGQVERAIMIAVARHDDIMKWRRLSEELGAKTEALEQALAEVKTLRGIVPICCRCKKIREDDGFWRQVSDYLAAHTEAEFTHGFCPECYEEELRAFTQNSP